MINRLVALIAFAGFVLFLAILMWFVREPDLIVVSIIGILLAAYAFWRELARQGDR